MEFQEELSSLINKHSKENESNTPDFLLAQFISGCLTAYTLAVIGRDKWYGISPEPAWGGEINAQEAAERVKVALGEMSDGERESLVFLDDDEQAKRATAKIQKAIEE